jgi:hypothetical protein
MDVVVHNQDPQPVETIAAHASHPSAQSPREPDDPSLTGVNVE